MDDLARGTWIQNPEQRLQVSKEIIFVCFFFLFWHHPWHSALSAVHLMESLFWPDSPSCAEAQSRVKGAVSWRRVQRTPTALTQGQVNKQVHLHFYSINSSTANRSFDQRPDCSHRRAITASAYLEKFTRKPADAGRRNGERFRLMKLFESPLTDWAPERRMCATVESFFLSSSKITGRKSYSCASDVCPFK